jgi:hypothetical protein
MCISSLCIYYNKSVPAVSSKMGVKLPFSAPSLGCPTSHPVRYYSCSVILTTIIQKVYLRFLLYLGHNVVKRWCYYQRAALKKNLIPRVRLSYNIHIMKNCIQKINLIPRVHFCYNVYIMKNCEEKIDS